MDEKEVHTVEPDGIKTFTKVVDGKQYFIEDKVIFPLHVKETLRRAPELLASQQKDADDIHCELSNIDFKLQYPSHPIHSSSVVDLRPRAYDYKIDNFNSIIRQS